MVITPGVESRIIPGHLPLCTLRVLHAAVVANALSAWAVGSSLLLRPTEFTDAVFFGADNRYVSDSMTHLILP